MTIDQFSQEAFQAKLEENILDLTYRRDPMDKPKAYLLGGQSGSGKSALQVLVRKELNKNVVIIDGDTFRSQHPNAKEITEKYGKEDVKYTAKFAGQMVEQLVEVLSDQNYNLLIEGTLRTTDVPLKTATLLKEKGYDTELLVMVVNPAISYLSTISRYEKLYAQNHEIARATPKEHHDLIVEHLPNNLEELKKRSVFSNIRMYKRSGEEIYNQQKSPNVSPKECILEHWESPISAEEVKMVTDVLDETMSLLEAKDSASQEVQATMQELLTIATTIGRQTKSEKMKQHSFRSPKNKLSDFDREYE